MTTLRQALQNKSAFVVTAELTGGPGYDIQPIKQFLADFRSAGTGAVPAPFNFAGVTLPQNPGGVANLDPSAVLAELALDNLFGDLDFIPHLTCKDLNSDALFSALIGYRNRGIETIFALTGDKPVSAKGVFELESVGLLQMTSALNRQSHLAAKPGKWDQVLQFFAGAAVSPFKYTEPSQMQQYYKMEKKIAAGARFLITQVGWDWQKSLELMCYLKDSHLDIPVLGNVFFLTTANPAPRLMHSGKLPGCFVSDELFETLKSESLDKHIDRAAQQVAMYRSMGAAGVDIGGVHDFDTFRRILEQAAQIGANWEQYKDNLYFPPPETFYLYKEQGQRATLARPKKTLRQREFDFMHRLLLDPDHTGFHAFQKVMSLVGTEKNPTGLVAQSFTALERAVKYAAFQCQECGDCYLPENFGYCTMGGCEKGLANSPCGDATVEGMCGNDTETLCRGEQIYLAAAAEDDGRDKLKRINKPRNPSLAHTSSILNHLFGQDHNMKNAIISIGEAIHASIPRTGAVMRELTEMGSRAYEAESGPLNYIRALIEDQVLEGADYIAVNVDALGETDPQLSTDQMIEYVRLVRTWGRGVPVCIDSSDNGVLKAGLQEWYATDHPVKPPLVNSIKVYTADELMPLKKEYDFAFVGLLVGEGTPTGPGGSYSVDELYDMAKTLFTKAVNEYGFKAEQIFLDSTVFPLAIDFPMEPGAPGYTYRAFETISRIKSDPAMKGVHCSLGISNCCRDLPGRRIGICRAYVAKAMEHGLDAGIVNVNHHYGRRPPDPGLLELVEAFADSDGTVEHSNHSMTLMKQFCDSLRRA